MIGEGKIRLYLTWWIVNLGAESIQLETCQLWQIFKRCSGNSWNGCSQDVPNMYQILFGAVQNPIHIKYSNGYSKKSIQASLVLMSINISYKSPQYDNKKGKFVQYQEFLVHDIHRSLCWTLRKTIRELTILGSWSKVFCTGLVPGTILIAHYIVSYTTVPQLMVNYRRWDSSYALRYSTVLNLYSTLVPYQNGVICLGP